MSDQIEFLLSDEYVSFSAKIAEIHALKKACKEEMKKKYEEFQAHLKELDVQAQASLNKWEEWKTAQSAKSSKLEPEKKVKKEA